MASFIQGKYTKTIFMSGTGYYIGLFKVSDVSDLLNMWEELLHLLAIFMNLTK